VRLPAADDLFRPTGEAPEVDAARDGHRDERRVRAVPPADDTRSRRPSGLRRDHGLAVDRGRMVREAIALVLADLEEHGLDSLLVQRLIEE
jgi:hypothetical protein